MSIQMTLDMEGKKIHGLNRPRNLRKRTQMMAPSRVFGGAFFQGMAQALDLTGGMARRRLARLHDGRRNTRGALAGDWSAIGHDLSFALRRYRELHEQ